MINIARRFKFGLEFLIRGRDCGSVGGMPLTLQYAGAFDKCLHHILAWSLFQPEFPCEPVCNSQHAFDSGVHFDFPAARTIDYCFLSEAMKSLPQLRWLKKGSPLPAGTLTSALASDARRVLDGDRDGDEIDVMDWLGGTKSVRVSEEVLRLGRYGKVLTILHSGHIGRENEPEEEREEEDLRESWTPRFRR